MLLDKYEQEGLLFNKNFKDKTSTDGIFGYRGELVLIKGEVADDKGHTKPPVSVMRHVILLEKDDKLNFVAGFMDELDQLNSFLEAYKNDFADDMQALFYVVNITKPMKVEAEGITFILIPQTEGVTWNELIDELAMEKGDFKGQSAGDKIVTMWEEFKSGYSPKFDTIPLNDAFTFTADIKREAYGAV